jgi:hypothetical protein
VREGRRAEQDIVFAQLQRVERDVLCVEPQARVRQLDPLRRAGRARGVEDDGDVIAGDPGDALRGRAVERALDDDARIGVRDPLVLLALAD